MLQEIARAGKRIENEAYGGGVPECLYSRLIPLARTRKIDTQKIEREGAALEEAEENRSSSSSSLPSRLASAALLCLLVLSTVMSSAAAVAPAPPAFTRSTHARTQTHKHLTHTHTHTHTPQPRSQICRKTCWPKVSGIAGIFHHPSTHPPIHPSTHPS